VARNLKRGDVVRVYPEFGLDTVRPGQVLVMVVTYGAARIEQHVEAMQPARRGERLFVRRSDGVVFATVYAGGS
jgi:flagella basal body P-ring formation protein FlgA